jgi:phosphopentomutase
MAVHIGKIIQGIVKQKGISVTDFAHQVTYSRRNVYQIFDKETIDTGLLIKIGKVLGQNLFLNYVSETDIQKHIKVKSTNADLMSALINLTKKLDSLEKEQKIMDKKGVQKKQKKRNKS